MSNIKDFDGQVKPGKWQEAYWQTPPTRKEVQECLDEYSIDIKVCKMTIDTIRLVMDSMDSVLAFFMMKTGIQMDDPELVAFMEQSMAAKEEKRKAFEVEMGKKKAEEIRKMQGVGLD